MEENKSLKEEVQKSLNDLNEVKACFAVFTDGIKNNVCVGGFGNDIINSLANMFMESPETLKLIEVAVKRASVRKKEEVLRKILGENPFESCEKTPCKSKEDELKEMMSDFFGKMTEMLKN